MHLEYLREFLALADSLSFSATAKQLYLTQSVLSRHIASVEEKVGVKLFQRDSHHVRLTEAGRAFRDDIQITLNSFEKALNHAKAVDQAFQSAIVIGYLRSAANAILPSLKKWFIDHERSTKLCLLSMEYGDVMSALETKKIDLALTLDIDSRNAERYDSYPLYSDCYYVAVGFDHPWAIEPSMRASKLEGEHIILPDPEYFQGVHDFITGFLPSQVLGSNVSYYRDIDTLFLSIELGEGISLVSGHHRALFGNRIRFIPLEDTDSCYHVCAMWAKGEHSAILDACLNELKRIVRAPDFQPF